MSLNVSPEHLKEIEKAVSEAEAESGGEIVPVFSRQSATYEIALWRGAFIGMAFVAIVLSAMYLFAGWFLLMPPYFWVLIPVSAGIVSALAVSQFDSLRRKLIGAELMISKVEEKAKSHFYDHNVSLTAQRSGVLVFISFFEKKAIILADVGIAEVVPDEEWQGVVKRLTDGIKEGAFVKSISAAIRECGSIIAASGLQKALDGGNELSDSVIIES